MENTFTTPPRPQAPLMPPGAPPRPPRVYQALSNNNNVNVNYTARLHHRVFAIRNHANYENID